VKLSVFNPNLDQIRDVAEPEQSKVALLDMQDIARSELARRRRRLGNLTPDQELAVETLFISTIDRISELITALKLLDTAS